MPENGRLARRQAIEKKAKDMQCWMTRKILPLYLDRDEIPFPPLRFLVDRHLASCPSCCGERERYRRLQALLKSVKGNPVPPALFENYREEIERRIEPGRPKLPPREERRTGVRKSLLPLAAMGLGACLTLWFSGFSELDWSQFGSKAASQPSPWRSESHRPARDAVFSFQEGESFGATLSHPETGEYELKEARPMEVRSASF